MEGSSTYSSNYKIADPMSSIISRSQKIGSLISIKENVLPGYEAISHKEPIQENLLPKSSKKEDRTPFEVKELMTEKSYEIDCDPFSCDAVGTPQKFGSPEMKNPPPTPLTEIKERTKRYEEAPPVSTSSLNETSKVENQTNPGGLFARKRGEKLTSEEVTGVNSNRESKSPLQISNKGNENESKKYYHSLTGLEHKMKRLQQAEAENSKLKMQFEKKTSQKNQLKAILDQKNETLDLLKQQSRDLAVIIKEKRSKRESEMMKKEQELQIEIERLKASLQEKELLKDILTNKQTHLVSLNAGKPIDTLEFEGNSVNSCMAANLLSSRNIRIDDQSSKENKVWRTSPVTSLDLVTNPSLQEFLSPANKRINKL